MKLLLPIALLTLFTGCKTIDKFTQFHMDYEEEVTIPSSTSINLPFNLFTPDVQTSSESEFAVNDTRKDLVEEITLEELTLTLTSPQGEDFSFLESIEVFINADGLSELRLAHLDPVPGNSASTLSLNVSGADFKEYIKKDRFTLRLNTTTDELLTQDHTLRVYTKFFVDAEVLGQ